MTVMIKAGPAAASGPAGIEAGTAGSQLATRSLALRLPVDELSRYAGLTAAASAVLAVAGILSTAAYLSAWNVPGPLVRLDPLTAALRSETVLYQCVMLGVTLFGMASLDGIVEQRRIAGRLAIVAAVAVLGLLGMQSVLAGFTGPAITVGGGLVLYVLHRAGRLTERGTLVWFAMVALVAAFQTGTESGRVIRDDPAFRTQLVLSARTPIAGLGGGREEGGAYHYRGLYLVFRDGESVYVSRDGAGSQVWIVPAMHVMALGVAGPEAGS
ncbi:MAG TPA: hypothetical protein VFK54_02595 [Candidatus Limnocylindrales bacterium]|nr:hypothetical protein [Candidatus Limnocylindrales bacterium]